MFNAFFDQNHILQKHNDFTECSWLQSYIFIEIIVCKSIKSLKWLQIKQNSSADLITVMVSLLGSRNFLQANKLSGNLVPRFHHLLHL